ncbi:MAG TPA: hypothetical protein VI078_13065 [bacterium]
MKRRTVALVLSFLALHPRIAFAWEDAPRDGRHTVEEAAGALRQTMDEAVRSQGCVGVSRSGRGSLNAGLYGTVGFGTGFGEVSAVGDLGRAETYFDWQALHFVEAGLQAETLRMGLGWTGWDGGDTAAGMNQVDCLVTWFPLLPHGFYIKAGLGLGLVDVPAERGGGSYGGFSGRVGLGWEFPLSEQLCAGVETGAVGVTFDPSGADRGRTEELSATLLAVTLSFVP